MTAGYRGYRQRTRIVAPPSVSMSVLAFVLVAYMLAAGWPILAPLVIAAYIPLGGVAGGRAPTWHVFAYAAALSVLCVAAAVLQGQMVCAVADVAAFVVTGGATYWTAHPGKR